MLKRKCCSKSYSTTLLTAGKTVSEIHYGPFSYAWWIASERNINNQIKLLVPINLGMKTLTKLNGRNFIITVLEPDIGTSPGPRYQATCESKHRTQVKKLKKNHVKEQLKTHGIVKDMNTNKRDLVKKLEIVLAEETLAKISDA
ncbi:8620_t:CDS:2 [Funneliformis caledonium]|uniref:8620_t:CDS:1 n=1 Tax=Funneliformis caledonium TaxID=1117310 RepID=A0A9N9D4P9_9GLOM|nr:8620_t:CDS:2 [Funneliformis caledonium]